ncbi:helix-turn-helix domain-containing protein [Olivibacter sp. LS-1]|uniref:XRE family transcriptional regulator n=1 Tax=Olivibacter sp. LS-1 TaxID=2592345 RepID=UPI0011EA7391|nr:LexA family transcriptional regulator [Olivibacter sp. LS-1]QEL01543.1 helix-turn-helix domain-containing protein [Olivibacter sp. LS-1]
MNKNFNIIEYLLETYNINQEALSKRLGVSKAYISNLKKGKPIGKQFGEKIAATFGLELGFVLTGSEKPTTEDVSAKSDNKIEEGKLTPIPFENYMMVEYEDLSTSAGYLGVNDLETLPDTKKRLIPKEFERGKYLVVRVDGHSMDDGSSMSIPDGTEILIRELPLTTGQALPIRNNLFVIVSKDGVVLKQIIEHNLEEGYIRCHSYNPKFKDYNIPLSDVLQIFLYRKIVSFRPPIPDITVN